MSDMSLYKFIINLIIVILKFSVRMVVRIIGCKYILVGREVGFKRIFVFVGNRDCYMIKFSFNMKLLLYIVEYM